MGTCCSKDFASSANKTDRKDRKKKKTKTRSIQVQAEQKERPESLVPSSESEQPYSSAAGSRREDVVVSNPLAELDLRSLDGIPTVQSVRSSELPSSPSLQSHVSRASSRIDAASSLASGNNRVPSVGGSERSFSLETPENSTARSYESSRSSGVTQDAWNRWKQLHQSPGPATDFQPSAAGTPRHQQRGDVVRGNSMFTPREVTQSKPLRKEDLDFLFDNNSSGGLRSSSLPSQLTNSRAGSTSSTRLDVSPVNAAHPRLLSGTADSTSLETPSDSRSCSFGGSGSERQQDTINLWADLARPQGSNSVAGPTISATLKRQSHNSAQVPAPPANATPQITKRVSGNSVVGKSMFKPRESSEAPIMHRADLDLASLDDIPSVRSSNRPSSSIVSLVNSRTGSTSVSTRLDVSSSSENGVNNSRRRSHGSSWDSS